MEQYNIVSNAGDEIRIASNIVSHIFNGDSNYVRKVSHDQKTYYIAYDVAKMLNITNITDAINSISVNRGAGAEITFKYLINNNNCCRKMHVLTVAGVLQMILNGNTEVCKRIKEYISLSTGFEF